MPDSGLKKTLLHVLAVAVFGLAAYSGTFDAEFHFDDFPNIVENPAVQDLSYFSDPSKAKGQDLYGFLKNRYVGYLSFALNYRLHGLSVWGYHAVNISIHLIASALVYLLVLMTFRTPFFKGTSEQDARLISLFSSLIFAVHPVQTQAVTYIVQRFTSLSAMFYLLSLVLYVKWRGDTRAKRWLIYSASLIAAVLAVKTKEMAFTLPFTVALYEFMFFEGKLKDRIVGLAPFFLVLIFAPFAIESALRPAGQAHEGATGLLTTMPRFYYIIIQLKVIMTYLRLLVLPVGQNLDYDYDLPEALLEPDAFVSLLGIIALIYLAVYLLRHSQGRKNLRLVSFGIFWFFITLSVESGLIPIADVIFEHRLYLPSAGMIMAASCAVFQPELQRKGRTAAVISLSAVVLVFGIAAFSRNSVWKTEMSLWEDVVKKSPSKARGFNSLGWAYFKEGMTDKAIELYGIAIGLDPKYSEPYNNIGVAYNSKGMSEEALVNYEKALSLRPDYVDAIYNLGNVYIFRGMPDKGIEYYEKALTLRPQNAEIHNNLGTAYLIIGDADRAIKHLSAAISLSPERPDPHFNLAVAYLRVGDKNSARRELIAGLTINPSDERARAVLQGIDALEPLP